MSSLCPCLQAVEAKEGLELRGTGRTSASTTFQSFFRFYDRLAGMTVRRSRLEWPLAAASEIADVHTTLTNFHSSDRLAGIIAMSTPTFLLAPFRILMSFRGRRQKVVYMPINRLEYLRQGM